MEFLALYVYEFAFTAVPAFIVYLISRRLLCSRLKAGAPSAALAAIFSVYLFALLHLTGAGTLHDAMRFGLDPNPHQMNLIPFANFAEDIEGHLLNVLLFIPLGLIVPLLSENWPKALSVAATAILASLVIEVSQLLNSRVTDVDDLCMNIAGALVGYAICLALFRRQCDDERPSTLVVALMLTSAFIARFVLFDEIGLAKVLFGF